MKRTIFIIIMLLVFSVSVYAEKIYLKDGDVFEGKIIKTTEDEVVISNGKDEITVALNEIKRIEYNADTEKKEKKEVKKVEKKPENKKKKIKIETVEAKKDNNTKIDDNNIVVKRTEKDGKIVLNIKIKDEDKQEVKVPTKEEISAIVKNEIEKALTDYDDHIKKHINNKKNVNNLKKQLNKKIDLNNKNINNKLRNLNNSINRKIQREVKRAISKYLRNNRRSSKRNSVNTRKLRRYLRWQIKRQIRREVKKQVKVAVRREIAKLRRQLRFKKRKKYIKKRKIRRYYEDELELDDDFIDDDYYEYKRPRRKYRPKRYIKRRRRKRYIKRKPKIKMNELYVGFGGMLLPSSSYYGNFHIDLGYAIHINKNFFVDLNFKKSFTNIDMSFSATANVAGDIGCWRPAIGFGLTVGITEQYTYDWYYYNYSSDIQASVYLQMVFDPLRYDFDSFTVSLFKSTVYYDFSYGFGYAGEFAKIGFKF